MSLRDLALLILICLVWGLSNVVSKIVVGQWGIAPLFYTAMRFAVVLALTFPWLLPAPRPIWRILAIGVLMGGGNFALLFMGLKTASPSAAAIVLQLGVPITTLLSVVMLGERIHWRRALGIALTMAGALTVIWHPEGVELSTGLWLIVGATVVGSLGGIMMKQMEGVAPLRFQAWVALASLVPMALGSLLFENGQWAGAMAAGWPFVGAVAFTAIIVSVLGHTAFYGLIQRYEANLLAPLTLMAPLATIAFGVLITHDHFDVRMAIGAALAMTGVLIVALRRNHVAPLLLLLRERP